MIRRTLRVAVWLAIGAAVLASLYWLFLSTPESNVLMLAASALLVLAMIAVAAIVVNAAVLIALGGALPSSIRQGVGSAAWFLAMAIPAASLIWLVTLGDAWLARRSGEISAWFIARFGWAAVTPLFTAEWYLSVWLRWVLLPVTALAGLAALLAPPGDRRLPHLPAMWHWRTLLVATVAFALFVALPWRVAFWQTSREPHSWIEPAAAGMRLALVAVSMSVGFAIMVVAATERRAQVSNHVQT